MKILFLSHNFYPFVGGIEVITEMYCRSFTNAGHEIHLITWREDPDNTPFPFKITRRPGTAELFRAHAWADLVFENNPSLRLSWPAIFFNRPSIVVIHTWISRMDGTIALQDRLKRKWLSRSTKVIAISESIRKSSFPAAQVIGNPYRADQFRLVNNIERNKDFIFLGRLVSDKGVDMAIKAISKIDKQHTLTIVGDGPELQALKILVIDLDLQERVVFAGILGGENLVNCLNQHRFILIPSKWEEPFGLVALEGLACGCLPIVSDGGGLADAVGDAGVKFERNNEVALIEAINTITSDEQLEKRIRYAAPAQLANYSPTKIIGQYLEIIASLHK